MDDDHDNKKGWKPKVILDEDETIKFLIPPKPSKPYNPYDLTLDYYKKGEMFHMVRFFLTYINPADFLKYAKETFGHQTYVDFLEKLVLALAR